MQVDPVEGVMVRESVSPPSGLPSEGKEEDETLLNLMPATEDLSSYYSATSMMGSLQNPGSIYSTPHMQELYQLGTNNSLVLNMNGYYQQLMKDASVGSLLPMTDGFLLKNAAVETEFPPEECYYGGTESDDDTSSDNIQRVQNMDSANEDGGTALDDYVSTLTDSISREDFNYGRDLDYEYLNRGIDDTIVDNDTEVEAEMDEDINQGVEVTGVEAEINGFVAHDMPESEVNPCTTNENTTCSELGDCGCAKQVIAQSELNKAMLKSVPVWGVRV